MVGNREGMRRGGNRLCMPTVRSPKLVVLLAVFKTNCRQLLFQRFAVDVHPFAEFVERRILVAQFHIDDAEEHHRVVG